MVVWIFDSRFKIVVSLNKLYNHYIHFSGSWFQTPICTPPRMLSSLNGIMSPRIFDHDDVIKWKHFPRYWPFVRGIHRSPVNSPHKGQWRRALMFSLICTWINGWVNNHEAGDYDVTVPIMTSPWWRIHSKYTENSPIAFGASILKTEGNFQAGSASKHHYHGGYVFVCCWGATLNTIIQIITVTYI